MKTCLQCGASVPDKKAFCAECGGTMMPKQSDAQGGSAPKAATTVLTQPTRGKRKKQASNRKAAKRSGALSIYWGKRERMDEE